MKKKMALLLSCMVIALSFFSGCSEKFDPKLVTEALEKQDQWFFNGGDDTLLNAISFENGKAHIEQVSFDGNGRHENGGSDCEYVIDDKTIQVTLKDGSELGIAYTVTDGQIILDEKEYFTAVQVDEGLQGYWECTTNQVILGSLCINEHHLQVDHGTLRAENACPGQNLEEGEYYYYGPDEGSYTIGFGKFETDMRHGNEYFYNIIDGQPTILHYDDVFEPSEKDGFPGENGYSF